MGVENNDIMSDEKFKIEFYSEVFVSEYDLEDALCKQVIERGQAEGVLPTPISIEETLYHVWGINIALGYTADDVEHVTRFGKRKKGIRYSGYERHDLEWTENPMCSKEMKNKIENLKAKKYYERW